MNKDWIELSDPRELPERPLLSVVMITYNHETYLAEAIEGVLIQDVDFEIELIIGEDCSSDRTREIAIEYQKKYPKLIKLFFSNRNAGMARNFAHTILQSRGKYIAICEGDDFWTDSKKLRQQVSFLENNEEYVICYTNSLAFDERGVSRTVSGGAKCDLSSQELQRSKGVATLTSCFRNVLTELPPEFYDTRFGDKFLWSLLGHYGEGKFLKDIEPSMYRVHDGGVFSSKTGQQKADMWITTSDALYRYYSRIDNESLAKYFLLSHARATVGRVGAFNLVKLFVLRLKRRLKLN